MGPHFFKCGKSSKNFAVTALPMRFNGAALFQVRKEPLGLKGFKAPSGGFNGAALFQVRKAQVVVSPALLFFQRLQWGRTFSSAESSDGFDDYPRAQYASMGPHFFKCGKVCEISSAMFARDSFNGAALFQVRKGDCQLICVTATTELQWGRTFSSAERLRNYHAELVYRDELQWGRTFSSAESRA